MHGVEYIAAPPRMAHYIKCSTEIYNVYLKYIAPSDKHVYSVDEVLMDVTNYLPVYKLSPQELARAIMLDVLETTGITAAAGIGTNLYLAAVKRINPLAYCIILASGVSILIENILGIESDNL